MLGSNGNKSIQFLLGVIVLNKFDLASTARNYEFGRLISIFFDNTKINGSHLFLMVGIKNFLCAFEH